MLLSRFSERCHTIVYHMPASRMVKTNLWIVISYAAGCCVKETHIIHARDGVLSPASVTMWSVISVCTCPVLHSVISVHYHRYRHKNVVQILGVCTDKGHVAYVMERMEKGSLMEHLHVVLMLATDTLSILPMYTCFQAHWHLLIIGKGFAKNWYKAKNLKWGSTGTCFPSLQWTRCKATPSPWY